MWHYPIQYRAFKGIKDGASTRAGLFALLTAKGADFSDFTFFSDLTQAFLDAYLNRSLRECFLMDDIAAGITYDPTSGIYSINSSFDVTELIGYLQGKLTETQAIYDVMTQEDLNIVSFNDVDTNVYGKKTINRDYDKVTIDITNGQKKLTDVFAQDKTTNLYGNFDTDYDYAQDKSTLVYGQVEQRMDYAQAVTNNLYAARTNTDEQGEQGSHTGDVVTKGIAGFNSSSFSDSEKTTTKLDKMTHTLGGGTDTVTKMPHLDTNTTLQHTDTDTRDAHKDTITAKQHTDTVTRDGRTDTHTNDASSDKHETAARQDKEEVQTYTDTLTHTRHIVLSPDKFFAIQKEMADYNLYASVLDAVRESVTKGVW